MPNARLGRGRIDDLPPEIILRIVVYILTPLRRRAPPPKPSASASTQRAASATTKDLGFEGARTLLHLAHTTPYLFNVLGRNRIFDGYWKRVYLDNLVPRGEAKRGASAKAFFKRVPGCTWYGLVAACHLETTCGGCLDLPCHPDFPIAWEVPAKAADTVKAAFRTRKKPKWISRTRPWTADGEHVRDRSGDEFGGCVFISLRDVISKHWFAGCFCCSWTVSEEDMECWEESEITRCACGETLCRRCFDPDDIECSSCSTWWRYDFRYHDRVLEMCHLCAKGTNTFDYTICGECEYQGLNGDLDDDEKRELGLDGRYGNWTDSDSEEDFSDYSEWW
ncbi:hypothetical protein DFJ74DRAFT_656299 [Hyaloraphidium curvatum]|nr:hypothetical protein DFJ74DRAFT_656299 [Hyaloraphidium curvatum]